MVYELNADGTGKYTVGQQEKDCKNKPERAIKWKIRNGKAGGPGAGKTYLVISDAKEELKLRKNLAGYYFARYFGGIKRGGHSVFKSTFSKAGYDMKIAATHIGRGLVYRLDQAR